MSIILDINAYDGIRHALDHHDEIPHDRLVVLVAHNGDDMDDSGDDAVSIMEPVA